MTTQERMIGTCSVCAAIQAIAVAGFAFGNTGAMVMAIGIVAGSVMGAVVTLIVRS